eukprot:TRINITY_DN16039_c0_g1_i1.p1 TRINITY_DN16039_c0_g1~~TRINITY_DN16039_c0_g1_i1.p1  ORF type:complete len:357 (+),score=81.96 TRINITY_DN16039_c0_g1_i1:68-1138(+)
MDFSQREWVSIMPHEKMPVYDALRDPHLKGMHGGSRIRAHIKKMRAREERMRKDPVKAEKLSRMREIHATYGMVGAQMARKKSPRVVKKEQEEAVQVPPPPPPPPEEQLQEEEDEEEEASRHEEDQPPKSEPSASPSSGKHEQPLSDSYSEDSYREEEDRQSSAHSVSGSDYDEGKKDAVTPPYEEWTARIKEIVQPDYGRKGLGKPVQVGDCLWLGDVKAAKNIRFLQDNDIMSVLNCAPSQTRTSADTYSDTDITYMEIQADDDPDYPLIDRHLPEAASALEAARDSHHNLLIHCFQGVNRSATLVISCLMKLDRVPLTAAVAQVHRARPVILQGNDGFLKQLIDLANSLGLLS